MSVASILGGNPATLQPQLLPVITPPPSVERPYAQLYGDIGDGTVNISTLYTVPFLAQEGADINLPNTQTIQILRSGIYCISYSVRVQTSFNVDAQSVQAGLFLNGGASPYNPSVSSVYMPSYSSLSPPSTVNYTLTNTCVLQLEINDTIQLKVVGNAGGSQIVTVINTGTPPFETQYGVMLSIHSFSDIQ